MAAARPYTLGAFERFCRELRTENGKPMKLEGFQREMLAEHFDGATEMVIVIPKKNGKTSMLAALALFHLERWEEAEVVIGASSRDQARILFKQAAGLIRRSGLDEDRFVVRAGYSEVWLPGFGKTGPRLRVLAADVNTADGVIPTLALIDELHRHPSGELYGVFRDGLGPRGGRMLTISTAGATMASPLGSLRQGAHALPGFRRDYETCHNYARTETGGFVYHEWCLDPNDDVTDLERVKLANPASWQTIKQLAVRRDSPTTTPWQWKRFACGIWTEGEEPWIDPQAWDDLADSEMRIQEGETVYLAVDIGVRHDTTAIVVAAPREERIAVAAHVLPPPRRGSLPLEQVENTIRDFCGRYNVIGVAYDPWSFRRSAEILSDEGILMVEFPQSPERMASASATLYRAIESRDLIHDGDGVLRAHVLAGITKETERGWRLQKDPKIKRPIDALIALSMAVTLANQRLEGPKAAPLVAFA